VTTTLRVPTGRLDTELRLSGVRDEQGMAYIELRQLRRDVSDVDPAGYHDAAPAVRIPVAYLDVFEQRLHQIAHELLCPGDAA
jgi:hypothetical protein